jgi:hypothetical protein
LEFIIHNLELTLNSPFLFGLGRYAASGVTSAIRAIFKPAARTALRAASARPRTFDVNLKLHPLRNSLNFNQNPVHLSGAAKGVARLVPLKPALPEELQAKVLPAIVRYVTKVLLNDVVNIDF